MSDRITAPRVQAMKARGQRIACLTAYDATFGAIADEAGVDLILVGDSLANVVMGYDTTIPVSMDEIIHHTRAARRGVKRALLVADLPFGSYQVSTEQAVTSAIALVKAGADAVKLEGAYTEVIRGIAKAGIPVMGHVGFTPQSVHAFGGFRVQGRGSSSDVVLADAQAVSDAGAFSIVLELIPADLATTISGQIPIPTIGIGAGAGCDGQIQVIHDVLGLTRTTLKHARAYASGWATASSAIESYTQDVREGTFPTEENSF